MQSAKKKKKSDLVPFSPERLQKELVQRGWEPTLTDESYANIIGAGFRGKNLALASVASQIALHEHPLTLRSLLYRIVSAAWLPSTDRVHYRRTGRVMTTLRESKVIPFSWIVDNIRSTIKPSSWSGLGDFIETVQSAYRKDFWASLPEYVHIIVEKDAIAGTLSPITRKYDVALSPIRGYVSLSFANEIAELWNKITKPIYCFYLGDFDASGFDLERDIHEKLQRYCRHEIRWERLGVNKEDFADFDLIPLKPKKSDKRYKRFVEEHGHECAELDAIPATELRRRVEEAITRHIPAEQWERLQETERREKASFVEFFGKMKGTEQETGL